MAKKYTFRDLVSSWRVEDDGGVYALMESVRKGVSFSDFHLVQGMTPFSIDEWSRLLHISRRTLERYKNEARVFDTLQSERIIRIALLMQQGKDVFGTHEKFHSWLSSDNVALGGIKPRALLDNVFGIELLKDELLRIEHGVLA